MYFVEENWQTTRPTIREKCKFMFNNDLFSDVKFVVPKADGECESKQVIPAHKFVLSISSLVFETMFYGMLAETGDSIELPDCEYESLLELFRYMYSDEVNLSGSNVMGVLYLAKKYMVRSLADRCIEYLQDNIDPSNVFSILPSAQKYEAKVLVDRCWEVIDKKAEETVKSDGFTTIERSLLETVVMRDTLSIKEIKLFKAVDLWATNECERQGLAADGAVKRRIVGEEVIKGIRFPTMKLEDFASVVLDSEILKTKEVVSIVKHLSSVASSPVGFPETKRSGLGGDIQRCCRFGSKSKHFRHYGKEIYDAVKFSVNKDIELHGVCFFGRENNSYSLELKLKEATNGTVLAFQTGRFQSKLLHCEEFTYFGFQVLFDTKITLKRNTKYEIFAEITGPDSFRGENGIDSVDCQEVTFTFLEWNMYFNGPNETKVKTGQFPELLFSSRE
ncbi:BTB/POZ domain-containing protein 6-like [Oculina patagonica]